MRLTNKRRIPYYQFVFTAINMLLIIGVALYILETQGFNPFPRYVDKLFIGIPLLLYVWFYLRGRQIFEYDSDGEALNFFNKNIVLLLGKDIKDEFPKYKLLSYDIVDAILFKRLYIKLSSKKGSAITLKYEISYLNSKEIRDLKFSLNKVIKANKEEKSKEQ